MGLPAGPAWAQPGGMTVRAGGEEATVVADQLQQVGGATDLLIAISNVEITRGQTRLLADRVELNRDTGQAVAQGKAYTRRGVGLEANYRYVLSRDHRGEPAAVGPRLPALEGPLRRSHDQPNQRIGFHADARYNVYDLGLREANADVRLVYPRFAVAVGPRFNEQGGSRYAKAEALVKVRSNVDVRGSTAWDVRRGQAIENRVGIDWRFSCWSVMAEYVNRRGDENEFRISINLLGLGQVGTSARSGF